MLSHCSARYWTRTTSGIFQQTRSRQASSIREIAELESRVKVAACETLHPFADKTFSKSWVRRVSVVGDRTVRIHLQLPTLLHPGLNQYKRDIESAAAKAINDNSYKVEFKTSLEIPQRQSQRQQDLSAPHSHHHHHQQEPTTPTGVKNVSQVLAVYSCKGGVGKSTIATNIAYTLARMGGRVGLLDCDVYGPSLPVLIKPPDVKVRPSPLGPNMVYPIEYAGVKVLSLGFVSPTSGVPGSGSNNGAAVMRGPMAAQVVRQLVVGTDWGALDVLILDMPPGTGDVQLTVCQDLELTGALCVGTPSQLAIVDVLKGIEMFQQLGVPTLAYMQNMSYFDCKDGSRHFPFGVTNIDGLTQMKNLKEKNIFHLPISSSTNTANDSGLPLCLDRPDHASEELQIFDAIGKCISKELFEIRFNKKQDRINTVRFMVYGEEMDIDTNTLNFYVTNNGQALSARLFTENSATQITLNAIKLRYIDPKTGELQESDIEKISKTSSSCNTSRGGALKALKVIRKGKYGFAVEWSDRSTIIYSFEAIAKAIQLYEDDGLIQR